MLVSFIDNLRERNVCWIGCLEASSHILFFRSTDAYMRGTISLNASLSMVFATILPRSSRVCILEVVFQVVLGFAIGNTPFILVSLSQISKFYPVILASKQAKWRFLDCKVAVFLQARSQSWDCNPDAVNNAVDTVDAADSADT